MNNEIPFNPLPIPDLQLGDVKPVQSSAKVSPRKRRQPSKARKALDLNASARRLAHKASHKARTSWRKIKGGLQLRLARLNSEQLKRVLIACGVAATAALVICALAKHVALVIVLLAVLGAAVVLKIWNRILTLGL
jgi:hypothetical protein